MTEKIKNLAAEHPFKLLFIVTICAYYVLIPIMSLKMGINADERWQVKLSEYGLDFYLTLGADTSIMRSQEDVAALKKKLGEEKVKELGLDRNVFEGGGLKYYGGLYEITVGIINRMLGFPSDMDPRHHDVRHFFLALFGCSIMLLTGLVAKEIFGWRAAWLALILIFISPRFLGHSMMNPKDIPYAFGNILTTLFLVRYINVFRDPGRSVLIGLILGIAATLNVRPGGLLLIIYFIFFTGIAVAYYQFLKKDTPLQNADYMKILKNLLIVSIAGYFLGLVLWPFGLIDPIHHPLEGIRYISKIQVNIRQLFEGEQIFSNQLPWYYLSKYLVITNPIVVLTGVVLLFALMYFKRKELNWAAVGILVFTIAFPLEYIVIKKANVYSGWRHVLFVYPPIIVLAAGGWEYLMQVLKSRYAKIGIAVVIAAMSVVPVKWIVANHPYEYVFFNPFVGGTKEAYKNYVTDYWMISIKEATDWLIKNEIEKNPGKKIVVGTNCTYPVQVYLSKYDNVQVAYIRYYERSQKEWDFGLFYVDYVSPHQLKNGYYPPDNTVYTVEAGGAPLCAVIDRSNKSDFEGYEALNAGNYQGAIENFRKAIQSYPKNEAVYTGLGMAYLNTQNMQGAIDAFGKSLQLYPESPVVSYYLGIAYAQTGDFNKAIFFLERTIKANPGFKQAYQLLGNIYQQKGDNATAKKYLDFARQL